MVFVKGVSKELFDELRSRMTLPPDAKVLTECSRHPGFFAKYMLGLTPYAWQWLVMEQIAKGRRKIIINTSRQIGKSTLVAIVALWAAIFNKGKSDVGKNTKIGIISRSEQQSKKIIARIHDLIRRGDAHLRSLNLGKGYHAWFSSKVSTDMKDENTKSAITFVKGLHGSLTGSYIKSFPPTDMVLGETFDIVFRDEASRIPDDIHYRAISPTLDKFGKLDIVTSTPKGLSGFFYEVFNGNDESWDRFEFTIDAIKYDDPEHYKRKLKEIEEEKAHGRAGMVSQEYYCSFVSDKETFFENHHVRGCFDENLVPRETFMQPVDVGVDVGGLKSSHTVVTVTHLNKEGVAVRVWHKRYPVQADDTLFDDLVGLRKRFPRMERLIIEKAPVSDFLIRQLKLKGLPVVELDPNRDKVRAYSAFRAKLAEGKVKTYPDKDLLGEMLALTSVQGVRNFMIHAPSGYTDDMIDSFVFSTFFFFKEVRGFKSYDLSDYSKNSSVGLSPKARVKRVLKLMGVE